MFVLCFSRLEQIANTPEVRRSPRLSQRHGRREDHFSTLTSITNRRSLRSKSREVEPVSVLNESGQSVPLSFDMEDDNDYNSHKTGEPTTHTSDLPQHLFGMINSGVFY